MFNFNIEAAETEFPAGTFDCVICADVLEHLVDPLAAVKKIRRWLTPGGRLVASIPNLRHHSILTSLLEGNWEYESAGLLDNDHVRFFTDREIEKLCDRAGFAIEQMQFVPGDGYEQWKARGRPPELRAGKLHLAGLAPEEVEHFYTYQYFLTATPRPRADHGLTSVVIVTFNELAYTRQCLKALHERTDDPLEIIVVDNGSTDGTLEFLEGVPGIRLICNPKNAGYPAAVNQGIRAATGRQVLLLNNDVILTSGWLRHLLEALEANPSTGMAGPHTNCTAGHQRIATRYPLCQLDDFAWNHARAHAGQRIDVPELTGFCLLIKREVIERIGLLDEQFGIGVYDDIDYCRRAIAAGYRLVIAAAGYVHHFGHRSFQGNGIDQDALAVENEARYRQKWTTPERLATEAIPPGTIASQQAEFSVPCIPTDDFPTHDFSKELLALLPEAPGTCLVLGAAAPRLAREIRRLHPETRAAVAISERAQISSSAIIQSLAECRSRLGAEFPAAGFDCVICEPLCEFREPALLLKELRGWLKPGGAFIAGFPTVRHHETVTALLQGSWSNQPRDGNDDDPLRFCTRHELEKLLSRAGFQVDQIQPLPGPGSDHWIQSGKPAHVSLGSLSLTGLNPAEVEEFFTARYLFRAVATPPTDFGLTSIIIVTHNQLAYTHRCLESIKVRTDEPYELILIDNGSTDGTPAYLRSRPGAEIVLNPDNRGFPTAVNQGIRKARGQNILLLNNDCIVTTGWLNRLLQALHRRPEIGLAGPCSNNVSGTQQIPVSYDRLDRLDRFSWEWGRQHAGEEQQTDRLVGFCLLFKRELLDKIGELDERFGIGCFEDDDFCRRALAAGYHAIIARDAFVHHFGGQTFRASGLDFGALLRENQRKFAEKWLLPPLPAVPPAHPRFGFIRSPHGGLKLVPLPTVPGSRERGASPLSLEGEGPGVRGSAQGFAREVNGESKNETKTKPAPSPLLSTYSPPLSKAVRLSLCLIVRDNETTIRPCLESIAPWVDEIIVVDTGSVDRTPDICRQFGALLFEFPWCDDFAAARNESLKHARGEWIFWMDSDDTITPACGRKLRHLVGIEHPANMLGYVMQVHCPGPPDPHLPDAEQSDITVVDHVKLFRNRPELRFSGRLHEQILPAIRQAGGEVAFTDIYVVHSGSDHSLETRQRKLARDLLILRQELADQPDHPFVLFNLGMTHADAEQHDLAIDYLRRCTEVSLVGESHLRKAYALLVSSYAHSERHDEGWEVCVRGLELFPDDKELLFRSALLHHHFGRFSAAEHAYLRILNEPEARHFASVDAGVAGFKARQNLALVYEDLRRLDLAEEQWRQIIAERPSYLPGWQGLAETLEKHQHFAELVLLIREMRTLPHLAGIGAVFGARQQEREGDLLAARRTLESTIAVRPLDPAPLRELCRLTFEQFHPRDSIPYLQKLAELIPGDAAVHHNLATAWFSLQCYSETVQACIQSLEMRSLAPRTWLQLGHSLKALGRPEEAADAWREGLRLSPEDPDLRETLLVREPFPALESNQTEIGLDLVAAEAFSNPALR